MRVILERPIYVHRCSIIDRLPLYMWQMVSSIVHAHRVNPFRIPIRSYCCIRTVACTYASNIIMRTWFGAFRCACTFGGIIEKSFEHSFRSYVGMYILRRISVVHVQSNRTLRACPCSICMRLVCTYVALEWNWRLTIKNPWNNEKKQQKKRSS